MIGDAYLGETLHQQEEAQMLKINFVADGENYRRIVTLPDGNTLEGMVTIPARWHQSESYPWVRQLHEYSRPELEAEGKAVAAVLFGEEGIKFLSELHSTDPLHIVIHENADIPELARVPWEIAYVDGRFLATDEYFPIVRRPAGIRGVNRLTIHSPLRMALISASPKDQNPLMVEEELLTIALSLDEPMASGRLVVDEVMNCTRERLKDTLRRHDYDIVYFTGHGAFHKNTGYLCLEMSDGTTDLMSADDFAAVIRKQKGIGLLFLNCCDAASVGATRAESFDGFGDVARKAMKQAAPQVVATQSAIDDDTGRKVMKTFFEELCEQDGFDVAAALAVARADVEDGRSRFHDFYHFVHLSVLERRATIELLKSDAEETGRDWQDKVVFRTPNRMDIGRSFVGRFSFISRIEDAWWKDDVKIVGIHGMGGIGKTFLCGRMEQRSLTHHLPSRQLSRSIWIDFREGTGSTVAGFLRQLEGIARDFGFQTYREVLDDFEAYPTPLEKLRPWFNHLNAQCGGKALLILDNLESALDSEGGFKDPDLQEWFVELLARSPGWKILVTCRHQFEFFPHGRMLATSSWVHLTEMGVTERLTLLNRDTALRQRSNSDKREILKCAGGHPYIIHLVSRYLRTNPTLPDALRRAAEQAADYAQLDWFLSMLKPDELDWLAFIAVFPAPRDRNLIVATKRIRDKAKHFEALEASFDTAMHRLTELSLIESGDGDIQVHPLLVWQLLENRASAHRQPEALVSEIQRAVAIVFLNCSRGRPRQEQANLLLQGTDAALEQSDNNLLKHYLQCCARASHGFITASIFADIVRRAEVALLKDMDEEVFFTLGMCAETLGKMRHFTAAAEILDKMLRSEQLPSHLHGKMLGALGILYLRQRKWAEALREFEQALASHEQNDQQHEVGVTSHSIGMVYQEQRAWSLALESYEKALEWHEKTGQLHKLGSTWHQIGRVKQLQRQFPQALESYQQALEWKKKTGQHHELGSTWHQIGRVNQEQREWAQALESYQKALEWKKKTGQHHQVGATWHQIGMVWEEQREWPQALESYQKALQWSEKTGEYHELGGTWHQIGTVYEEQREWSQALESYQKALQWHEKTGQHNHLWGTRHQIGSVWEKQDEFSEALGHYLEALRLILEYGMTNDAGMVIRSIRRIFPRLSAEEQEGLKADLPEKLYGQLKEKEGLELDELTHPGGR